MTTPPHDHAQDRVHESGSEKPEPANWWTTLRTVLITTGEIALKVLPILLAAIERANAGQPFRDPQLALTTGPIEWYVDHGQATVTMKNTDNLNRPVTITLTPGSGSAAPAESFVVPGGGDQPMSKDVWQVIAGGANDAQVAIEIPPPSREAAPPGVINWADQAVLKAPWDRNKEPQFKFYANFDAANPADKEVTVAIEEQPSRKKALVLRAKHAVLGPISFVELQVAGSYTQYLAGVAPGPRTLPQLVAKRDIDPDTFPANVQDVARLNFVVWYASGGSASASHELR
jgi:hypothetical protein